MAEKTTRNPLDIPDDEIDNIDWTQYTDPVETTESDEDPTDDPETSDNDPNPESETPEDDDASSENTDEKEVIESQQSSEEDQTDPDDSDKDDPSEDEGEEPKSEEGDSEKSKDDPETDSDKEEKEEEEPDYKAEYQKLFEPFKANGRMMQIDSIDDARTLMQMGANYNKKMAGLKPHLKVVKMLQNNDLLDEEKLNFLIDLDKKNPDAIKKLLQDSELNVVELDPEEKVNYRPNTYNVNDQDVELESTLAEIRDTETYDTTLEIISNKFDQASQRIIYDDPSIIPVINEHVATGIYDQVMSEVEKEKMLGRLKGLSDLEAYKVTGDRLNAEGKLKKSDQNSKGEASTQTELPANSSPAKSKSPTARATKKADPKLRAKKRAASSTKSIAKGKGKPAEFNPLALSDEEFEKTVNTKYI